MNERETIPDIIAEKRFDATTRDQFDSAYIVDFCDRLEASHKREVGDCAKLRKALVAIKALTEPHAHEHSELGTVHRTAKAFLAQQEGGAK